MKHVRAVCPADGHVRGRIFVNGHEGGLAHLPSLVGFVPQEDIVHANLTVFENLYYNAMLRLPNSASQHAKKVHIIQVSKVLGIDHLLSSRVGDAARRGISGGQKKRVNIGMELVAMPAVIFMDEPTSGLDGATTIQLARCLRELRNAGLTIICVIHQPRYSVFREFSHLLLLGSGGKQIYCGVAERVTDYLTGAGFRLPEFENAADWFIDVACGLSPRYLPDGSVDSSFTAPAGLFALWKDGAQNVRWDDSSASVASLGELLQPREAVGMRRQIYYLVGRSFRQHDGKRCVSIAISRRTHASLPLRGPQCPPVDPMHPQTDPYPLSSPTRRSFVVACILLVISAAVFSRIVMTSYPYSYGLLLPWLTCGSAGAPLFMLIVASFARPLFASERLNYARELRSGFSAFGYWLGKVIYSTVLLPFFAVCFATGSWLYTPAMQHFFLYVLAYMLLAWYWTGAASEWG